MTIHADGRIELDFRGMEATSYRRIIELLQDTVGPVEPAETETEEGTPPGVQRATAKKAKHGAKEQDIKES